MLARRTRASFWMQAASREIAPKVARLMATELGRDQAWQTQQLERFDATAVHYLPT
jgi:glycerol-3-phosphate dehydrogenase